MSRLLSFDARVNAVRKPLEALATWLLGHRGDAEDAVQETLLRVWERDPENPNANKVKWDPARLTFHAFCRLHLFHYISDLSRTVAWRNYQNTITLPTFPVEEMNQNIVTGSVNQARSPEGDILLQQALVGYLDRLSDKQALAIQMLMMGYEQKETAAALGISESHVYKTRMRLRDAVREIVGP